MPPTVLFDILTQPATNGWLLLTGFEILGIAAFCFVLRPSRRKQRSVAYATLWLTGWTAFFVFGMAGWYRQNVQAPRWARDGDVTVTEGTLTEYEIRTFRKGRREASFVIDDQYVFPFQSNNLPARALATLADPACPLRTGSRVRLTHHAGHILKIELLAPPPPATRPANDKPAGSASRGSFTSTQL